MTRKEFITTTKRKRIFQKGFEYFIALIPLVSGLYVVYQALFTDGLENIPSGTAMTTGQFFFCFLFGVIGLCGIWKVTEDYKILKIDSDLPVDLKKELLRELAENLKIKIVAFDSNPLVFFKYGGFFGFSQELRILIDKKGYLFDINSISVGIIDWGYKKRLIKKIKNEIASLQPQQNAIAGRVV